MISFGLSTFTLGGVHPSENKLSAGQAIHFAGIPDKVYVMLGQHLGAPAKAIVNKGDKVLTGQLIGQGEGFISANIHSPVSGTVAAIEPVADASGFKRPAIVIAVEGDEWLPGIDRSEALIPYTDLPSGDIVTKVSSAGIVGMGGATFPSHVKLSVPRGKKAEVLIVNGVECEPYLTSDHRLMVERPHEIVTGIRLIMKALGVEKAFIGIENNKPDAIDRLAQCTSSITGIDVVPLQVKYPQGGEKQLIKAITGREVPSGALPVDVGAVVFNVGSAFAVYEAVLKNKPLIERVVTITGKGLSTPSNLLVRLGTPVSFLLSQCGSLPGSTGKIISGGPMMGKAVASPDIPVVKGTSGVLLLEDYDSRRGDAGPCIRCAKCVAVCPMGLEPFLLMTLSEKLLHDRAEQEKITDCIECGSCSYICPANRPLLDYIRLGKSIVLKNIRTRKA